MVSKNEEKGTKVKDTLIVSLKDYSLDRLANAPNLAQQWLLKISQTPFI